jgi:hypothetical protein
MIKQLKGRSRKCLRKPNDAPKKGYIWVKNISGHWVQRTQPPKLKTAFGWAIVGRYGLYTGWALTKSDMISEYTDSLGMSWDECKSFGDRVVKITISYEVPRA